MHMPIEATARAVLVVDLIGDLDPLLAAIAAETVASHDLAATAAPDVTFDLSHVSRCVPEGVRDLQRLVDGRRSAGSPTALVAGTGRQRAKLKLAGIPCEWTAPRAAPGRHVMIARHAPAA